MAILCKDIIAGAVVECGARALGDTISAEEAQRGIDVLQSMFREAVEKGMFGRVAEVLASAAYTANENERVTANGFTITLPTTVIDAIDGSTRPPRDLAQIQIVRTAGTDPEISLWDAEFGQWVRIDNLGLTTEAPLARRDRHGMECALAVKLAPSLQRPPPPTAQAYGAGLAAILTNRLSSPRTYPSVDFF